MGGGIEEKNVRDLVRVGDSTESQSALLDPRILQQQRANRSSTLMKHRYSAAVQGAILTGGDSSQVEDLLL